MYAKKKKEHMLCNAWITEIFLIWFYLNIFYLIYTQLVLTKMLF